MNLKRKTQIIETAAKLFREHGYVSVSMRDLAKEMDLKAASLYNHISSKQEILTMIIMDLAQNFTTHIIHTSQKEIPTIEKLENIIEMHIATTIDKTDFIACMNREWKNLGEKDLKKYIELRDDYEDQLRQIIRAGMKSGELHQRNPDIFNLSMLSTLRTLYHWHAKNRNFNKESLKNNLRNNLLFGIAKQPSH